MKHTHIAIRVLDKYGEKEIIMPIKDVCISGGCVWNVHDVGFFGNIYYVSSNEACRIKGMLLENKEPIKNENI